MKHEFIKWEWLSALFSFILSIPFHFVYDYLGGEPLWVGYFFPINESVWEHLKLLFYPAIITGVIEYFIVGKKYQNFITAKTIGIFLGMLTIVISFYTYTGILGTNFLVADILTYVIGAVVMAVTTSFIVKTGKLNNKRYRRISIIALIAMGILFSIFTYNPPTLNIFKDATEVVSFFVLNMDKAS